MTNYEKTQKNLKMYMSEANDRMKRQLKGISSEVSGLKDSASRKGDSQKAVSVHRLEGEVSDRQNETLEIKLNDDLIIEKDTREEQSDKEIDAFKDEDYDDSIKADTPRVSSEDRVMDSNKLTSLRKAARRTLSKNQSQHELVKIENRVKEEQLNKLVVEN